MSFYVILTHQRVLSDTLPLYRIVVCYGPSAIRIAEHSTYEASVRPACHPRGFRGGGPSSLYVTYPYLILKHSPYLIKPSLNPPHTSYPYLRLGLETRLHIPLPHRHRTSVSLERNNIFANLSLGSEVTKSPGPEDIALADESGGSDEDVG